MNRYSMWLITDNTDINFPVLPSKIKVTSPGKNETTTVLGLGEVLILRDKGLRTLAWDCFFPANDAPYVTGRIAMPIELVRTIQNARDEKKPVRFLLTGTDLDVNIRVGIETFDYEERSGEVGDLYYSIKLSEWKDYSPRKIILTQAGEAKEEEPQRAGEPEEASVKTYTVVKGDCLWNIAKRIYGNGSDYKKIYEANKDVIGGNPNLIYPGQVFTIP